jgi:hypothetical protein
MVGFRLKKKTAALSATAPYNIQIGVADEYIAVVDVMQYRSDIHGRCLV